MSSRSRSVNRDPWGAQSQLEIGIDGVLNDEAACASDVRIKRTVVESGLLRGIKSDHLTPEIIADIGRETRQSLRATAHVTPAPDPKRLVPVEEEIRNLVDAIANGALRASPAMAERLAQPEAELAALKVAAHPVKTADIERLVGRVMDRYRTMVEALERSLPGADIGQACAVLRALFGFVKVVADEQEIRFEPDRGATQRSLLRAAGGAENNVAAEADLWRCLRRLPRPRTKLRACSARDSAS